MKQNLKKISAVVFVWLAGVWLAPHLAFAATLYFSPASGSFVLGSTFSVSVRANTQDQAVNTAEATVNYSPDTLELVKVSAGSTFTLQTPGSPSKQEGSAFFSAGLPTPGYTGSSGVLGVMTFRAKALGAGHISVASGKILLNDGLGTDALNSTSAADYSIVARTQAQGAIVVTSSTHPDQEVWYNKKDVSLSWDRPAGVYGYSFSFDQAPDTVPDSILDTTITTTHSYPATQDGVWYFHISGRGKTSQQFGTPTNFKVNIDTVPPEAFTVGIEGKNILPNQPVDVQGTNFRITFNAVDKLSGVSHYDVYVDEKLSQAAASSPYALGPLSVGSHTIKVTAFDQAGNSTDSTLILNVLPPQISAATITFPKLYLWIFLVMLLIINALVWALFFYRRKLWEARYVIRQLEHDLKAEENQHVKIKRKQT